MLQRTFHGEVWEITRSDRQLAGYLLTCPSERITVHASSRPSEIDVFLSPRKLADFQFVHETGDTQVWERALMPMARDVDPKLTLVEALSVGLSFRHLSNADEEDAALSRRLRAEMLRGQ